MVINLVLAWTLGRRFGALGLAGSFTIAAVFDFFLHLLLLRGRLGSLQDVQVTTSLGRTILATFVGALGLLGTRWALSQILPGESFAAVLVVALAGLTIGFLLYLLVHAILRSVELREVSGLFSRRLNRKGA